MMASEPKLHILVVEDEAAIRSGICDVLAFHGYQPHGVETGEEGLREALSEKYALVILDVMLPGMDGFTVCERLRRQRWDQPVIMLTAKGSEDDILHGFACGADDYVTKPFSVRQLLARVQAVLRRAGTRQRGEEKAFVFGQWQVDPPGRSARWGERAVQLSRRELDMLALFVREKGRIVSRRVLLREVWGFSNADHVNTRTVDMHIAKLRKKLQDSAAVLIETVRGEGYRFVG